MQVEEQAETTAPSSTKPADARTPDYSLGAEGAAAKLIQKIIDEARNNTARKERDRQDWQNLLLDRGGQSQWMVWDKAKEQFVERGYDYESGGLPAWIPRPVTNIYSNKIDGVTAILEQSEPALEFAPATDDDGDSAAAEVAESATPVLFEEIRYRADLKPRAARLVTQTDCIAFVPFYDVDPKHGVEVIPDYICQNPECEARETLIPADEGEDEDGNPLPCQMCGQPTGMALDGKGAPIGPEEPVGRMCCELVPSFEMSRPAHARTVDVEQLPWLLFHTRIAVDRIEQRWEAAKGLDLGSKTRGGSTRSAGLARNFADAMTQLSGPGRAQGNRGSDGLSDPVVYRLMHDPIESDEFYFPEGVSIVMVDDHVIEAVPLPTRDDQRRPVKNAVIWQYQAAAGTGFGKPVGDDLAPLQISRNTVEALSDLILMHEAAPKTFLPASVTLENQPTGMPGEVITYRSVVAGEKPTVAQSSNLSGLNACQARIEAIDQKIDELSHLNSVLQGARPEGDPTLGEVERLEENGLRAFRPALNRLVEVEKRLAILLLWIARDSIWSTRLRSVMGEGGEWDVQQFTGRDLDGAIDIRVDTASAWPKSPLTQRMRLKEALGMGLFPPPASDPELASKLLSMLGLAFLKPSLDKDRKQVARKLDRWKDATEPTEIAPPDPTKEHLPIHFVLLTNFLKGEDFEELEAANPMLAAAMKGHVQAIGSILAQQAAAAAAAQNPKPAGKDEKPAGDDPLKSAIDSGALRPAGGEPAPVDPMQELMAAGALVPEGAAPAKGVSVNDLIAERALTPLSAVENQPPV